MTDKERDELNAQANKIRERIVLDTCKKLTDDLLQYSDQAIVNSKTQTVRLKLRII